MVIPGYLAIAMPIAQYGTVGMVSHSVLYPPCVQKPLAFKTKWSSSLSGNAASTLIHAKTRTRIACWNVRTLGSLSDQSAQLLAAIRTMNEKCIELLALSETLWTGHAVTKIRSTAIIHSGSSSSRIHGVAIALSLCACFAWETAGSVFYPVSA